MSNKQHYEKQNIFLLFISIIFYLLQLDPIISLYTATKYCNNSYCKHI